MPPTTHPNPDPYVLARDFKSASRLNHEHYLWHETLGYDLHPTIHLALPPSPQIADVACGTGIWLRRTARLVPQARLTGYDISLEQCPPAEWLPRNMRLETWDVFDAPREDMRGAFDVVHVRLLFVVVRDEDPRPVIRSLMRLLRPGGWLQWDEIDVASSFVLRASRGAETPVMDGLVGALRGKGGWVGDLMMLMRECGLEEGKMWAVEEKEELARAFFDNHLAKDEEMAARNLGGGEEGKNVKERIDTMYEESKAGVVICTPKIVYTARKSASLESGAV